jgi:hypothetical protein
VTDEEKTPEIVGSESTINLMTEGNAEQNEEGWFKDVFQIHEDRWYSNGEPTKLVRDGRVESHDMAPLHARPAGPLSPSSHGNIPSSPEDLRRADDGYGDHDPEHPDYAEIGWTRARIFGSFLLRGKKER